MSVRSVPTPRRAMPKTRDGEDPSCPRPEMDRRLLLEFMPGIVLVSLSGPVALAVCCLITRRIAREYRIKARRRTRPARPSARARRRGKRHPPPAMSRPCHRLLLRLRKCQIRPPPRSVAGLPAIAYGRGRAGPAHTAVDCGAKLRNDAEEGERRLRIRHPATRVSYAIALIAAQCGLEACARGALNEGKSAQAQAKRAGWRPAGGAFGGTR